jgi:hypothetical protein
MCSGRQTDRAAHAGAAQAAIAAGWTVTERPQASGAASSLGTPDDLERRTNDEDVMGELSGIGT